jgi:hypothetical protein
MAAAMVSSILFLCCFIILCSNMIYLSRNEMAQQIDTFLTNFWATTWWPCWHRNSRACQCADYECVEA